MSDIITYKGKRYQTFGDGGKKENNSNNYIVHNGKKYQRIGYTEPFDVKGYQTDLDALNKKLQGVSFKTLSDEDKKSLKAEIEEMRKRSKRFRNYIGSFEGQDNTEIFSYLNKVDSAYQGALDEMSGKVDRNGDGKIDVRDLITSKKAEQGKAFQNEYNFNNYFREKFFVPLAEGPMYVGNNLSKEELDANYFTHLTQVYSSLDEEDVETKYFIELQLLKKNGDYEEKVQKGLARKNPSVGVVSQLVKKDGKWYVENSITKKKEEIKNILTFVEENSGSEWLKNIEVNEDFQKLLCANSEEREIYSYLLETDEKRAQKYLNWLMPRLFDRRSDDLKEAIDIPVIKQMSAVAQGVGDYMDSVGIKDLSNDSFMSAMQKLQSESKGADKYVMGAARNIGNMLPSMLLAWITQGTSEALGATPKVASTIGKLANATSVGISAKGSAYKQKIAEGWSPDDAETYSTLVGISEARGAGRRGHRPHPYRAHVL